jgi:hypothetical protein
MKSILISLGIILSLVSTPALSLAKPKGGSGSECTSQGKAYSELGEDQCKACGGKWTVSSWGCGGGIIAGSLTVLGGLLSANPIVVAGGVVGLGAAKDQCDGKCESKV